MKPRNAYCSFCRKSYTDVGPLVEGPDSVYICAECIALCQSIVVQELRRRAPPPLPVGPAQVRAKLDQLMNGQQEAKESLARAFASRSEGSGKVLLLGSSRGAKIFIASALAHALKVPFVAGDSSGLVKSKQDSADVIPLLYSLLTASDFDVEAAQRGVVYLDGVHSHEAQEICIHLWQQQVVEPVSRLQFDTRRVRFVCGGTFDGLDEVIAGSGRHPEQPVSADALVATGALPKWVRHLTAIARTAPLDEETLTRMIAWVDFSRADVASRGES